MKRTLRAGWTATTAAGTRPAYFACVLDRDHLVHLVSPVPCGTRCGLVLNSRTSYRLTLRVAVYDDEVCPECWAPFERLRS